MEASEKKERIDWFVVVIALWIAGFAYTFYSQQTYMNRLTEGYAAANARLEEAKARNDVLKAEYDGLKSLTYIEKVAREDLGMTRHGELPYIPASRR